MRVFYDVVVGHDIAVFRDDDARTRTNLFLLLAAAIAVDEFHDRVTDRAVRHILHVDNVMDGFIGRFGEVKVFRRQANRSGIRRCSRIGDDGFFAVGLLDQQFVAAQSHGAAQQ